MAPGGRARSVGVLRLGRRYGRSDHACCGYWSDMKRAELVSFWLADGLRAGQRCMYVGPGDVDALVADLHAPELVDAIGVGALVVVPSTQVYDLSVPIDPATQLAGYDAVVSQAVADGYHGVRVAADITPLVDDPARRESHLQWEQIADRYMTSRPLAPLCIYDARKIAGVDAIACAHPLRGASHVSFAVYGSDEDVTCVDGEVDALAGECFAQVLRGVPVTDTAIDLAALAFIDGRGAWLLHEELLRRRDDGCPLRVTNASTALQRVWELCGFDASLLAA